MSRGNHFMIDKFFRRSKVAGQAFGGALLQVACVVHAELNGLLVGPVFCGMRTEPTRCRTVTVLATHSIARFKCLGLLLWGDVEYVTSQALGRLSGGSDIQDFADTLGDIVLQHTESSRVFVLRDPDRVFVLENGGGGLRLHAAMATTGGASAGTVVLAGSNHFLIVKWRRCWRSGNCSLARRAGALRDAHDEQHEKQPDDR